MKNRIVAIPEYFFFKKWRNQTELRLICFIIGRTYAFKDFVKDNGKIFLNQGWIAKNLDIDRRTVIRGLNDLKEDGYIKMETNRTINKTYYTINWELIDRESSQHKFKQTSTIRIEKADELDYRELNEEPLEMVM